VPTEPDETPALAVIGGGQLARMMQQAAIALGVRLQLLAEAPDVSAAQVVQRGRGERIKEAWATLRGAARFQGCVSNVSTRDSTEEGHEGERGWR
jgi:phosphoribosylaminoimidazole carboxylase (NCAIR synthetase)